ncbi:MAG: hypothetical protein DRI69_03220 [Bacteroidetes bacterium]|nr:MAG: hypothetical protein DRI69_03220 [Bacteroidota bacterium]
MIVVLEVNLYLVGVLRNVFPVTTETMNFSGRMRATVRWCVLLAAVAFYGTASAQDWVEETVLNQGMTLSWSKTVLYPISTILLDADPALGDVSTSMVGSQLQIDFVPVTGAVGTAEFIVEHFSGNFPPKQITSAYRIFVDSSHVIAIEDYMVVESEAVDTSLLVLVNDTLIGSDSMTITDIVVSPLGSASISADGQSITFTPTSGYTGMTYLTYVVCDEYGSCGVADVNICVIPDGGFTLVDTLYLSTNNQTPVTAYMPVSGFVKTEDANNGTALPESSEAWVYTSDEGFVGLDGFTLVNDTLTRVIMIDVFYQDVPNSYAVNDVYYTRIDSTIVFDARDNDVKAFPIHSYTLPDKGQLTMDEMGVFTYSPDSSYVGAIEFTYDIKPLNGLETGRVVIYIGDMPPVNLTVYDLITPKETPLVLNYQIPLDGYNLILTTAPSPKHGLLKLYNGDFTIDTVGCDPISGYDMMVYFPFVGYTGLDSFEIDYCVVNGACERIRIRVDVQDHGDLGDCVCIDGCVWPGDADGSGQVDMADLLTLGWHVGEKGASRNYQDNSSWLGQYADDWFGFEGSSDVNTKYVDGNGDGVVSELDTQLIYDHYLRQHALIPDVTGLKADYEFIIIPPEGALDSGDLAVFEIAIGNGSSPVVDMHGIHFSLNLPTELYQMDSVDIEFHSNAWLGYDAPNFQMHMEPWHGRLDAGFTRTNATSATGAGTILTMTFIVVDDIEGFPPPNIQMPFNISAYNIGTIGSDGQMRSIEPAEATMYYHTPGERDETVRLTIDDRLHVFPNPVSNNVLKAHLNGDRYIERLEIYDMQGALRAAQDYDTKRAEISIFGLASGSYVLRVTGSDGVVSRKFQVVR